MQFFIMTKYIMAALVTCLALLGTCLPLDASSSIHVIIAADTKASNIEKGVSLDFRQIRKMTQKIAKYSGLQARERFFTGDATDPEQLLEYINGLQVDEDDAILFYFSGHGYRTVLDEYNPWPTLAFEIGDKGIHLDHVGEILKEKNARLTLLFADCCNNKIRLARAPELIQRKNMRALIESNYHKLFAEAHGFLMVAGCQPGDYSYTDDKNGSLYTISLCKSIDKLAASRHGDVNWTNLLLKTDQKLEELTSANNVEQISVVYSTIE